jgi:putative ABC transport system ATP-binding protein
MRRLPLLLALLGRQLPGLSPAIPPLILADEPMGNLDSKPRHEVMELLCCGLSREQGRSIVIETHDHRLRQVAGRVLWLEAGHLREAGDLRI